jgi:hypothetical protein
MTHDSTRLIRAAYTDKTIRVYQAYAPEIAEPAIRAGTFVPPFSRERMTWIKPSFGWMMYRSGWARKPGQERVLAIEIWRDGFEWALGHSSLSHFTPELYESPAAWAAAKAASPVRVQWDPDRSLTGQQLPHRAIQIGLSRAASHRYTDEWICSISNITPVIRLEQLVRAGKVSEAMRELPPERAYPVDPHLARRIGAGTNAAKGCVPAGCYSSSSVSMTTLMLSLARRNEMSSRLLAIENRRYGTAACASPLSMPAATRSCGL